MFVRARDQRLRKGPEAIRYRVDRVAHPQAEIGRDLIVTRARGVQPSGRRADQLGQSRLDVHVNVFERQVFDEAARLLFGLDRSQPRSEEHTSELQSLMRISYAVFCLKK